MDNYVDETMLELDRFAIGQPVPRSEDPVLLRGEGHYADDVSLPGQAYAVMVRSGHAHGVIGDSDRVAAAFAGAAHVTRLTLRSNRIVVNPMEPRSAIAHYDPARTHWTLHVGSQGVFGFRNYIADVLGVDRDKVRVLTDRVGG